MELKEGLEGVRKEIEEGAKVRNDHQALGIISSVVQL